MYIGPLLKVFHYFINHHIIIPMCSLIQFKFMNFIQYHIIVYVVFLNIFYYFREVQQNRVFFFAIQGSSIKRM